MVRIRLGEGIRDICYNTKPYYIVKRVPSLMRIPLNVTQIHAECKRFGKAFSLRSVAVYGGGSMWEQAKALQEGAEIVVCTPVREKRRGDLPFVLHQPSTPPLQQIWCLLIVCVCRVVWLTMLKRRPRRCREWRTWCLMRQIACLTWALVG